ncbi:Hypothetical predicted protein [Podarcis lilfordi]|uniref:Dynein heavy chain tail domain-containing protein n=1 Tax=Podarcis lilfordi TaxID=74358 RepID=A0AA35JLH3_9SAUR|nr:Hypothetical predicted protein [Podarcis lilfordi]
MLESAAHSSSDSFPNTALNLPLNLNSTLTKDERIDLIKEQAFKSFKLKAEKWNRFVSTEENQRLLLDFLDEGQHPSLVLFTGPGGNLYAGDGQTPISWKTKLLYVLRKRTVTKVSQFGYKQEIELGEVSSRLLDQVPILISQVLLVILSNPENFCGWPRVALEDARKHVEMLKNTVYVLQGHVARRTYLPLPTLTENFDDVAMTHYTETALLYTVETMVVQWTHLISDVLRLDSAQLLLQGENPGPSAEIQFWQQQKENLLGIYEQLQNPKVHKVTEILNRKRSSYYPGFKQLTLKVEEAVSEAQDICLYLGPLKCYIAYLEESSFSNIERLIAPLFHTICLIWTHSKYYCFANRIVVLLQEFCNLLIDREIFTSATDFLKLEKIEIGGLRGKILSEEIHCMNEEFHESWKVLQESKYDPLDYNNLEFLSDYKRYIQQINDFDNRLGTILNFAFQEPKGLESVFKEQGKRTSERIRILIMEQEEYIYEQTAEHRTNYMRNVLLEDRKMFPEVQFSPNVGECNYKIKV